MQLFIFSFILLFICISIMAIGVVFFNAKASRTSCGTNPQKEPNPEGSKCATGEAGLCPFEDESGALKMANMTKIK